MSEKTKNNVAWISFAVTCLVTVVGWVAVLSADRGVAFDTIDRHSHQLDDHETRMRMLERQSADMAADVRWIRQFIERNESSLKNR